MNRPVTLTRHDDCSPAASPNRPNGVNDQLTPFHARRSVENGDFAAFARRVVCAYARRVAAGDIDALTHLTALSTDIDAAIGQAVTSLHAVGYSWADIGVRLGITRQAA